jgi:hypothetical protein
MYVYSFFEKVRTGKTYLQVHSCCLSLTQSSRKGLLSVWYVQVSYNFFFFNFPPNYAALGGFDRGLYAEKWAPFVKVSI